MMTEKPVVLLAAPSYDGWRANGHAVFCAARSPFAVAFLEVKSSLLCKTFNTAMGYALVERERGLTHLLLLHADVKPLNEDWLQIMVEEMQRVGCDILSAIIPIKDDRGLTSTAEDTDPWEPKRYTMHEIMEMPETWTSPGLLFNTGMLLMDCNAPWFDKVRFTINDEISFDSATKTYRIHVAPEDWNFSRDTRKLGAKAFVTRKVRINHEGTMQYANYQAWGNVKHDKEPK